METGRPSLYDPDFHPEMARKLCLLGYTDKQLAQAFGIAKSTLNKWKKDFSDFSDSVASGKHIADAEVAHSLFRRATGYEYQSEKVVIVGDGMGASHWEKVDITAVVLPDPGAAMNWLKNRQPDVWRDKIDVGLPPVIELRMNLDGEPKKETE